MEILKFDQFIKMPWKNGGGSTYEILLSPSHIKIEDPLFEFRISMAIIKQDGDFSIFKGLSRILTIIKGNGINLNSKKLTENEIYYFSGDTEQKCNLLSGTVIDLGVIFNKNIVRITMMNYQKNETPLDFNNHKYYIFKIENGIETSCLFIPKCSDDFKKIDFKYKLILITVLI